MCDSAGANFQAIERVYGQMLAHCLITCQWHFLHNAQNTSAKVPSSLHHVFLKMCKKMATAATVPQYFKMKNKLEDIAQHCALSSWIKWWHVWHGQIFDAFRGLSHTGVNLAKMGNSAWKKREVEEVGRCMYG